MWSNFPNCSFFWQTPRELRSASYVASLTNWRGAHALHSMPGVWQAVPHASRHFLFLIFFFLHLPFRNFLAHLISPFLFVHGFAAVKLSSATISRTRVVRRIEELPAGSSFVSLEVPSVPGMVPGHAFLGDSTPGLQV